MKLNSGTSCRRKRYTIIKNGFVFSYMSNGIHSLDLCVLQRKTKLEWCKSDMRTDRWNAGPVSGCIDCYGHFGRTSGDKVRASILLWTKPAVFTIIGIDRPLFNVVSCSKCKIGKNFLNEIWNHKDLEIEIGWNTSIQSFSKFYLQM